MADLLVRKLNKSACPLALRRADDGVVAPLGEMLARAILDSLHRFVLPAVAGPARLVPLEALTDCGLSIPAMREAARRGRLQATRGSDGHWRSSKRWVDEYIQSRYRRV